MLFDPVFDVLVGLLKGLIDANEIGERGVLVHAVRAMPLLCREARDEARKDASFPYLMAYCRTLFDVGTPYHRYCDRLPPAVPELQLLLGARVQQQPLALHHQRT